MVYTVYNVVCVQGTAFSEQLCTVYNTVYTVGVQCTIQCTLWVYSVQYSVHCGCTVYSTVCVP